MPKGKVDIIVGTHRLLSKDVVFRDLGLLVIDEEQRFGVAHKEKLKQLRKRVDVLTMTATPIPRTLHMSLVGIRDMSVIETPPKDRLAIQTNVVKFDQNVIARAVRNEFARGGQVYFVHNRVESIFSIGALLTRLVPEAKVVVGHGQMGEHDLEKAMIDFMAAIKRDMESPTPMDRLLCGDVGYGKTEVSMRAAFKAVMDGKQVAYLAPTTVLAFQHVKTLRERFAGFPVRIDMLSRFRSKQELKQSLADLAEGKVDIIVGTHRLLSKDVVFRDLGLLVVDEEQRFGVAHKEKIKQLRKKVDVLTMTATPIPRTLNMSLVGMRDMSVIETPPKDRLAIETNVVKFDQNVIARAVRNELARGGQVYFVHNRVESIFSIGALARRASCPRRRSSSATGRWGSTTSRRP